MKANEMRFILEFMRKIDDVSLHHLADARYTFEPRDEKDRLILQFAIGEADRRARV